MEINPEIRWRELFERVLEDCFVQDWKKKQNLYRLDGTIVENIVVKSLVNWVEKGVFPRNNTYYDYLREMKLPVEINDALTSTYEAAVRYRNTLPDNSLVTNEYDKEGTPPPHFRFIKNAGKLYEFECDGIVWSQWMPPHIPEQRKAEVEVAYRVFQYYVVEKRKSSETNNFPEYKIYGDAIYGIVKNALRSGYINKLNIPRNAELEEEITRRFLSSPKNGAVIVADVSNEIGGTLIRTEFVSYLASRYVFPQFKNINCVGIGGGYTVRRIVELLEDSMLDYSGVKWVTLNNFGGTPNIRSPNHIVGWLQERFPKSEVLKLPFLQGIYNAVQQEEFEKLVTDFEEEAHAAVLSVYGLNRGDDQPNDPLPIPGVEGRGADFTQKISFNPVFDVLRKAGLRDCIAGEFCGHILDDAGIPVGNSEQLTPKYATSMPLGVIKSINTNGTVWVVAARRYKARATLMAVRTGLAGGIVIDKSIAEEMLKLGGGLD